MPIAPSQIAFQNYYYSQPKPCGGRDNNLVEDLFSQEVEQFWPAAKQAAVTDTLDPQTWSHLYLMIASLRARVPAMRELIEGALAQQVMGIAAKMDREGRLPPMPTELGDIWSTLSIAIDPHQSMHAMPAILESMNAVVNGMGFEVLHNRTALPFITSDNPVVFYDPRFPESRRKPYNLDRKPVRAELQFPIDASTLLRGATSLRERQGSGRPTSREIKDDAIVRRHNRNTARYAYRMAFARDRSADRMIGLFADQSPVLDAGWAKLGRSDLFWMQTKFGRRPQLPKWADDDPLPEARNDDDAERPMT